MAASSSALSLPRPEKPQATRGLALSTQEQADFVAALAGPLYRINRVCKPVLERLDEASSTGGATYDVELVSIEHVLPQTVEKGSEWAKLFPDEKQRDEWTDRVANLVLLTRRVNTRASNGDFHRNKKEYFRSPDGASPFVLTQAVLDTDTWTTDYLKDRQKELLGTLKRVWKLEQNT
jgi:hypothetical protein